MARRAAYLHSFDKLGEHNVAEIAATLRLGKLTEVCVKTSQDRNFLAPKYDASPMGISSLSTLRARRDEFAAEGIKLTGWHVLDGTDPNGEANFLAGIANILGSVELDLEPFDGFFNLHGTAIDGTPVTLIRSIDALVAKGVTFDIDADARASSGGLSGFGVGQMRYALSKARAFYSQSYWTDFKRTPQSVIDEAVQSVHTLYGFTGPVGVIFPWDGHADYGAAWSVCQGHGISDLGMWVMGPAGPPTYNALAQIPATTTDNDAIAVVHTSLDTLWRIAAVVRQIEHPTYASQIEGEVVKIKQALQIP